MPHLSSENWDAMRLGEAAGACAYLNLAPHKEFAALPSEIAGQSNKKFGWKCEKAMSGNARRDMSDRVPSASGFAGMAVHIVPVGVQAESIVCKPATLPFLLSVQSKLNTQ